MTGRVTVTTLPSTRSGKIMRRLLRKMKETGKKEEGNPRRVILEVLVAEETKVKVKGQIYGTPNMDKDIEWDHQYTLPKQFVHSVPETASLSEMQALVMSYANNLYPNYQIRIWFEEIK